MKKILINIIIIVILLFSFANLNAQYNFEWAKGFGGDREDMAKSVVETADGSIIVAGNVVKTGTHLWLLKLNSQGDEIWGKTYENNFSSGANSLIIVQDTCLVVAGTIAKEEIINNVNGYILKTDSKGNIIWEKEYGKAGYEEFHKIIQTKDGGLLAVGYSMSNEFIEKETWVIKTDSQGNVLWEKILKASSDDVANTVIETKDGSFIIGGYAFLMKKKLIRILKLDSDGNNVWDMPFGEEVIEEASSILELSDTELMVAGKRKSEQLGDFDALIYRVSQTGDSISKVTYGQSEWEEATGIIKTFDDKIAISGYIKGDKMLDGDFWLRIIDSVGHELFYDVFKRKSLDFANTLIECKDNGILLAGSTYHTDHGWDYALLKYQSTEKTRMKFIYPTDSLSAISSPKIDLDICVTSFSELKNVDISVNGQIQRTGPLNSDFLSSQDCKYPLFATIILKEGLNKIKVTITDNKDYQVIKESEIYYIPAPDTGW